MPYPREPFDSHKMNVGHMWGDKVNQNDWDIDVATKALYCFFDKYIFYLFLVIIPNCNLSY